MNADIDSLDRDIAEQFKILSAARDELGALRELREEALAAHLATLSDAAIMQDEALLRRVLREAFNYSAPSQVVHRLYATTRQDIVAEGIDGRDAYLNDSLPALQLRLKYRQAIGDVAEAMRSWARVWALGRPDLRVGIMERDLSRWASYKLVWRLNGGQCEVRSSDYGSPIVEGPLEDCLRYIAENLWLDGGPSACACADYCHCH